MNHNFMEKLETKLMPLAQVISKNKYLISIRDGFLVNMPLLVIGSFFMLINNFPVQSWIVWLRATKVNGIAISSMLAVPTDATFTIMAIFVVFGIGYHFAKQMKVNPVFGAVVSVMSWFMLMPYITMFLPENATEALSVSSIPLDWIGSKGIFIGILCAFGAVHVYHWVTKKGWIIKMPAGVPPTVVQSFAALIPITIVILVFLAIHIMFLLTPWGNAFNFIFKFLQTPLLHIGDSLGAMVVLYLFAHVLWFFGIHGTNITDSVFRPILITLSADNLNALQSNLPLPHIINTQFQDLFATYGGGGSTLSLLIAMLLFCKSKRISQLGKLAIIPGIFGINEPVIFGLPIVLNPTIFIPFVFLPMFNIIVTYAVMYLGIVPICNGIIMPWTTPPVISGFLSSGWQGAIFQIIMIFIGILVYLPFIKTMDKQYLLDEENASLTSNDALDELSFDDL